MDLQVDAGAFLPYSGLSVYERCCCLRTLAGCNCAAGGAQNMRQQQRTEPIVLHRPHLCLGSIAPGLAWKSVSAELLAKLLGGTMHPHTQPLQPS